MHPCARTHTHTYTHTHTHTHTTHTHTLAQRLTHTSETLPTDSGYLSGCLVHLAGVALTQLNNHVEFQLHLGEQHFHL